MNKYLILYRAPASAQQQMANATPEQAKAGMDAWMAWAQRAGDAIVDLGSPLGDAAHLGADEGTGHVGGYSILQAQTMDAVKQVLEGHPHLHMSGSSIDILQFIGMPGAE